MTSSNNNENRIKSIDDKLEELKNKKKFLERQVKYEASKNDRKKRARRLIETGALAEKYFELDDLTIDEREEVFKMFANFINSNKPKKYKK